jgi:rhomboid protease GluP
MSIFPAGTAVIYRTRYRNRCRERRLVLEALGIPAEEAFVEGWWLIAVAERDHAKALAELEAFSRESVSPPRPPVVRVPVISGGRLGLLCYVCVMLGVAVLANSWALGYDWYEAGAMLAGPVRDGEWWRTVTALTLHGDAGHLTANLIFGAVFGLLAGQALGGGLAWAGTLLAGALGNGLNALIQPPSHASIGASTAVFAALAMVVAHSMRYWSLMSSGWFRRWSPLIGGVLLLAYTGTGGERTDVVAHVTGFLAGLLIGGLGSLLPESRLKNRRLQVSAGVLAGIVVTLCWVFALHAWASTRPPS